MQDRAMGLGRTQKKVLMLLLERDKTVRELADGWPGLTDGRVRGALLTLRERELVDITNQGGTPKYGLTERGRLVELTISKEED